MKPSTEEEFYAYMRGDPAFQMTVQEASDFWYGVDKSIKRDKLDRAEGKGRYARGHWEERAIGPGDGYPYREWIE